MLARLARRTPKRDSDESRFEAVLPAVALAQLAPVAIEACPEQDFARFELKKLLSTHRWPPFLAGLVTSLPLGRCFKT